MDGAHSRTLQRALAVVKTKERLALALELPLAELEACLDGSRPLPSQAFITALDIVAKNTQGPK